MKFDDRKEKNPHRRDEREVTNVRNGRASMVN